MRHLGGATVMVGTTPAALVATPFMIAIGARNPEHRFLATITAIVTKTYPYTQN